MDTLELIHLVADDLHFLCEEWDEEITDDSLRRSSPVLMRLLVDGDLDRAWRSLARAREPRVEAPSLESFLGSLRPSEVSVATAGGAVWQGRLIYGVVHCSRALTEAEVHERYERAGDVWREAFSLAGFVGSLCIIVAGEPVRRREVIQYVADKLNSSDVEPREDVPSELRRKFELLDRHQDELQFAGKSAVNFELLSIGQSIAHSPDTSGLLARARRRCSLVSPL